MTGKTAVGRALLDAFVDGELSPEDAAHALVDGLEQSGYLRRVR